MENCATIYLDENTEKQAIDFGKACREAMHVVLNEGVISSYGGLKIHFYGDGNQVRIYTDLCERSDQTSFVYSVKDDNAIIPSKNAGSAGYALELFRGVMLRMLYDNDADVQKIEKGLDTLTEKSKKKQLDPDGNDQIFVRPVSRLARPSGKPTGKDKKGMGYSEYQIPYRGYMRTRNGRKEFVPPGVRYKDRPPRPTAINYYF